MNKSQRDERNAAIIADAPMLTIKELSEKYALSYCYTRIFLKIAGVAPKKRTKNTELMERIRELAPTHSYLELRELIPGTTKNTIARYISKIGLRIGRRENIRSRCSVKHKQLEILADLRDNPQESYSAIGLRHQCTREKVSQIAFDGRRFGFLPQLQSAEVA
jgi:hypothetical protein